MISYVTKKGNDWWTYTYKHQHLLPEMAMSGCGKMDLAKKKFIPFKTRINGRPQDLQK
jgi:hypothetical protein